MKGAVEGLFCYSSVMKDSVKESLGKKELRVLRRAGRARPVGAAVKALARRLFRKRGLSAGDLAKSWGEIVGSDLSQRTHPTKITRHGGRSVLTIRSEGAYALEVQHRTHEILGRLEMFCGKSAPQHLRIVQGPLSKPPSSASLGQGAAKGAAKGVMVKKP